MWDIVGHSKESGLGSHGRVLCREPTGSELDLTGSLLFVGNRL